MRKKQYTIKQLLKNVLLGVLGIPLCLVLQSQQVLAREAVLQKKFSIGSRYALGSILISQDTVADSVIGVTGFGLPGIWQVDQVQLAWFYKKNALSPTRLIAVSEYSKDAPAAIVRPASKSQAATLEKMLAFPTSPGRLSELYMENEVVGDDMLKGRPVLFAGQVAEIARGAFNKPYVFFPVAMGADTGLTCYFDGSNAEIRKIRKGSFVLVRGIVKGFLMQDVILQNCEILAIQ